MALHNKFCLIFAVFCMSAVALMQSADAQRCPPNQEYVTCGSACPPRCGDSPFRACTLQCVVGCQCRNGFLLNRRNQCVRPNRC